VAIDLEVRQGNWRAALETAELARARAFVDLIASRESGAHAPGTATDVTWRGAAAGPIAVRSDSSASPSTASDLTATAAHLHATLLQYWLSDDDLYAWVIAPDGTINGARTAVKRARVEQLVRTVATNTAATERTAGWKALYDVLIRPVEKHLPPRAGARLIVVPHGPLMQLPFAALRDPRGRYLVERFTLASVPSVTMLRYTRARRPADAPPASMLLVADPSSMPVIAGERRLPSLPGALEETRAIARLVPATRTTLLVRANATEPRVLAETPRKNVIHFATHAIVRDVDPWSSFLALGVPGDGAADGKLTAQKIYGLSLDADLVVLSACRSGGGLITGDGIASLARAFFYAGASSMIVSVWDVADEPAKRLLPAFYRSWLAGAEKDRALRSAQLALIRDLRAGRVMVSTPAGDVALVEDPALWAGFVLLGEPD
jgi:CHAT domain-containing protein